MFDVDQMNAVKKTNTRIVNSVSREIGVYIVAAHAAPRNNNIVESVVSVVCWKLFSMTVEITKQIKRNIQQLFSYKVNKVNKLLDITRYLKSYSTVTNAQKNNKIYSCVRVNWTCERE